MLGHKHRYKGYASYVLQGVDEETARYYQHDNMAAIIGDKDFKTWVYDELLPELVAEEKGQVILPKISMAELQIYAQNFTHQ